MFSWLLTALLNSLRRFAKAVKCPACKREFVPFGDRKLTHWRELMGRFPCPHCGYAFGIGEDAAAAKENPPGPFKKPDDSTIEEWSTEDGGVLFHLPPSTQPPVMLAFAGVWCVFVFPLFYFIVIKGSMFPVQVMGPRVIISLMALAGIALLYGGLQLKFGSHLIHLGPEILRFQRILVLRRTKKLKNSEIDTINRVVACNTSASTGSRSNRTRYESSTYQLQIGVGLNIIQFGAGLSPDEQHWLGWRMRDYLRAHGGEKLPPEVPRPVH